MTKNHQQPSLSSLYSIISLILASCGVIFAALSVPQFNEYFFEKIPPLVSLMGKIMPQRAAEIYYESANKLYDLRHYDEAIADYTHAIELDNDYAAAYNARGVAYYNLGDYQQAIANYTRAIELDGNFAKAYTNRGIAYLNLDNYEQAISDYTQAIEQDSSYIDAYNARGIAYINLGDYQQAISDYTHAIELDNGYANAYWGRGNAYYALGIEYYEIAITDYEQYAELTGSRQRFMERRILEMQAALAGD